MAAGNGSAGRWTAAIIKGLHPNRHIPVVMVEKSGASGPLCKEFPDYDGTVRGAVSNGSRLMDPLAELVKINPKSFGVGG